MQLIPQGPNIPEALLNAHAEGTVVFFCGAGVSVDAGYPLFSGLVEKLAVRNPVVSTPELTEAICQGEYDFALSIIQKKLGTNAIKLRHDTAEILSSSPHTLTNHTAILRLSSLKNGTCRLITTNFDRLFIEAAQNGTSFHIDSAPRLPIPKEGRWNSILHLHGLIPTEPDDVGLRDLVLTSADFGEAYLTDSYCSRFVVELLRNFTVVFVGYSLDDRIMRYLLDAISYSEEFFAATLKKGKFKKPYAFVSHAEGDKDKIVKRWELKEVTPIPYLVEKEHQFEKNSHHRLYKTLSSWADLASGGQNARVTLALKEAKKPFVAEDTFGQERLLWALRDADGNATKALATAQAKKDTASIDWLPFFSQHGLFDQVYSPSELQNASVRQQQGREETKSSTPEYLGSVTNGNSKISLRPQTLHLIHWMLWHLDTLELLDWLLRNGGVPHPDFSWAYKHPDNKDKRSALKEDQARLWDILTSDAYAKSHVHARQWFDPRKSPNFEDPIDALNFLDQIKPKLNIQPAFHRPLERENQSPLKQFTFDIKLSGHNMGHWLKEIIADPKRQQGLDLICSDISQLVLTGMNWLSLIGKVSSDRDLTCYSIRSISPHDQNGQVKEFGQLVLLLRASFDRKFEIDPIGAINYAEYWSSFDYPLFKRLFLYAANRCGLPLDRPALHLLTKDNGLWLWNVDTKREVSVYLRERVRHWKSRDITALCRTILKGPDRNSFSETADKDWFDLRDRKILRALMKLEQGDLKLPRSAAKTLVKLKISFPIELPSDKHDEFAIFSYPIRTSQWGDSSNINLDDYQNFLNLTATERVEAWGQGQLPLLRKLGSKQPEEMLKTLEEGLTVALSDTAFWSGGISSLTQSTKAASIDSPTNFLQRMWAILKELPDTVLQDKEVAHAIVDFWQLPPVRKLSNEEYCEMWDRLWAAFTETPSEGNQREDPIFYAINEPAGKLVEELFKHLWPKGGKIGGGLPKELELRISNIVERTDHSTVDASSVIVASRTEMLHTIAPELTEKVISSLLKWDTNPNASAYWSAFLWPARITPDLFELIERDCIIALQRPSQLERDSYEILCQMFLIASMEFKATSTSTTAAVLSDIGAGGLEHMVSFIRQRMLDTKEGASDFWSLTVKPWLDTHWPRDSSVQTTGIKEHFAMLALYSNQSFPEALHWLEKNGLLGESPTDTTVLYALEKSETAAHSDFQTSSTLPERFPKEVLHLLWVTKPFQWDSGETQKILDRIVAVDATIIETSEYLDLKEILRFKVK